jgi:phosphodiesterase/alkaline phosphatase D-like protein
LYLDVYRDPTRSALVASSAAATLAGSNNYQATATVTGLEANRRYWYRMRADDGSAGSTKAKRYGRKTFDSPGIKITDTNPP